MVRAARSVTRGSGKPHLSKCAANNGSNKNGTGEEHNEKNSLWGEGVQEPVKQEEGGLNNGRGGYK